jgi:hypothetical protein
MLVAWRAMLRMLGWPPTAHAVVGIKTFMLAWDGHYVTLLARGAMLCMLAWPP